VWRLDGLITGTGPDGSMSSVPDLAELVLQDDGFFVAGDGCNQLDGRWTLDDDVLLLSDVSTTDVACEGDDAGQAGHIIRVLESEPTVDLDGGRLTLMGDDLGLAYRAD
jgi:heat shock protein HslJ